MAPHDHLDKTREVFVTTPTKQLPIWAVVVDGEPYVRSYHGPSGAWYRRALREGRVVIDGETYGIEPIDDAALDERVSDAFRAKYGELSPDATAGMVSPEVAATTLRLTAP